MEFCNVDFKEGFSIIIPTWNNLDYLQTCVRSLQINSAIEHQLIIHVNEGADGTGRWLSDKGLLFTSSEKNIGICRAVNQAAALAEKKHILYMNDDMYALPGWDEALWRMILSLPTDNYMLSGTMIEPVDTGNTIVVNRNFGQSIDNFREQDLLKESANLVRPHWNGASWPPTLVPKRLWDKVGGFSESFSPGMYSDPDLSRKLWEAGVRNFVGVGDSLVYHFQAKSTGKVIKNNGRLQFLKKWHLHASTFYTYYLRMGRPYYGELPAPSITPGYVFHWLRGKIFSLFGP